MTHIVDPIRFKTKKAFKEAIKAGEDIYLSDPSFIYPNSGRISEILNEDKNVYVTNHPKRSWFACLRISKRTGKIIVD